MDRRLPLLAALLLAGCRFDASGTAPWPGADGAPDGPLPDLAAPDRGSPDRAPLPDRAVPDLGPLPDTGGSRPLTEAYLGQVFDAAQVDCVDKNGVDKGYSIPIVDSATLTFFAGSVALAGAPADTLQWVGGNPAVVVLYNLNACDDEYPGQSSWSSAGLLVRKAALDGLGRLVLQPGATVYDVNLIDILSDGTFQGSSDFAQPDDSKLPDTPQLVNPVGKAKQLLIQEGSP
jgi:hypothetical protein